MIRLFCAAAFSLLLYTSLEAQAYADNSVARRWADSVLGTLNLKDKIAQLVVVRASDPSRYYLQETEDAIQRYHVGGLCFFQGGPLRQAELTNGYQRESTVPLLITQDAEWGLGMRLDSVLALPHQMMLGAVRDTDLIRRVGLQVGLQCRRLGVEMDLAPDIDVNNNPDNPVINDRSFGENKYVVARYGVLYTEGLQAAGVMSCAKHFPGHGDTRTDSHLDLPLIAKTRPQLDSLELYPFKALAAEGVAAVMVGHLYIPSLDNRDHRPTSLSDSAIRVLRDEWGYRGIVMTDALDMKGVTKYFPKGQASLEAVIAGNDLLVLPPDIKATLKAIRKGVRRHQISASAIDDKVRKVLMAKYVYGPGKVVDTAGLIADLNRGTGSLNRQVALAAITLLRRDNPRMFPLMNRPLGLVRGDSTALRVAYLGIGLSGDNRFSRRIKERYQADAYYLPYSEGVERVPTLLHLLKSGYQAIIVGVHGYSRHPQGRYGLSIAALSLLDSLQSFQNAVTFVFGNPYAIRSFSGMRNLVVCYEDDSLTQDVAVDMLEGRHTPKGILPVSIGESFTSGSGIVAAASVAQAPPMPTASPEDVGLNTEKLQIIDSLAQDAIVRHATPGCVVLVARNGKIVWDKAYGYTTYDRTGPVKTDDLYDLASVTKVCATTVSVMQLYDEGKIDLDKTLGDYLPWLAGTDKAGLLVRDVMLHQAGLKAFIPFYKDVTDKQGDPLPGYFADRPSPGYEVRVAEGMYLRSDYVDTMYADIATSPLGPLGKYVYSDNDFILMGKIVETVSGMTLDQYALQHFYIPMGMTGTGFHPLERFPLSRIAPTEEDKHFRRQLLRGDVHDPGAAMFGGVSGHAGLFSDAYDLSVLLQMLLNEGELNGVRYIRDSTVRFFTAYQSAVSRRGLGFDKPEKDNATLKEPYPCPSASPETFGHTGFTGTCIWVDPRYNLIFVFLSNRVCPDGENNRLSKLNVRSNIEEAIYKAME
jgi:beta-N-acetylhexosaminidase